MRVRERIPSTTAATCTSSHLYPGNGTWDAPASCSFCLKSQLPIDWDMERACLQLLPFRQTLGSGEATRGNCGQDSSCSKAVILVEGPKPAFSARCSWDRASFVWRHRVHVSDLVSGQGPVIADLCCSVSVWMTYDVSVYRACFSISPLLHACCNNVSAVPAFDSRTHSICLSSTPRFSCSMRLRD